MSTWCYYVINPCRCKYLFVVTIQPLDKTSGFLLATTLVYSSVDLTGFEQILSARIMLFGNLSGLKFTVMVCIVTIRFCFYF